MNKELAKALVEAHTGAGQMFAGKRIASIEPFAGGDESNIAEFDANKIYAGTINASADNPGSPSHSAIALQQTEDGQPMTHLENNHPGNSGNTLHNYVDVVFRVAVFNNCLGWFSGYVLTLEDAE